MVRGESEPRPGFGKPQEAQMHTHRPVTKMIAVALAATAVAATAQVGTQAVGAQARARPACTTTTEHGYPNAVPPILPPPPCSDLAAIRRAEALEGQAFFYHLPASARYSPAEMDAYASECRPAC
jgi:hypothetical protein